MNLSLHRADLRQNVVTAIRVGLTREQIVNAIAGVTPQLVDKIAVQIKLERERNRKCQERRSRSRRAERAEAMRKAEAIAKCIMAEGIIPEKSIGMEHHAMGRQIGGLPHGHLQPWPDMARMYDDIDRLTVLKELRDHPGRIQPTYQIYTLGGVA